MWLKWEQEGVMLCIRGCALQADCAVLTKLSLQEQERLPTRACSNNIPSHLRQHIIHRIAGLSTATSQHTQQAQDGHLQEWVVDAAHIIVCEERGEASRKGCEAGCGACQAGVIGMPASPRKVGK